MKKTVCMILMCAAGIRAETKTWVGGSGNYSTPEMWSGSTVPVAGDDVVIDSGTVTVAATDASFAQLASVSLGSTATLISSGTIASQASATFAAGSIVQVTSGDLIFHGFASGAGFTKEGAGNVRFVGTNSTVTAYIPGLRECMLSGGFNLTDTNTGTRVTAALEMVHTAWPVPYTSTTFAYTGEIYLDGSRYTFVEGFDENVYLKIGETVVLSDVYYITPSTNTIQLAAGWYPIDLRVGNNLGGAGPQNVAGSGGGLAWKKGGSPWQLVRDLGGGDFLRSPGKLAVSFTGGITITTGTVVIANNTFADSVNSGSEMSLGGVTLNAGTFTLSNCVTRATALNGAAAATLRINTSRFIVTNETTSTYLGQIAGVGTFVKDGIGRLQWQARSSTHYSQTATVVNNGTLALGDSASWLGDYDFGNLTLNAPAILETLINGNTQFANLWGDGTITNTLNTGGPYQLRIIGGPCEFAGNMHGNTRYYSRGAVALTGTNSTYGGNFAITAANGYGITGAKKIGLIGQPSSLGKSSDITIRDGGGTFLYLGTGETTDKTVSFYNLTTLGSNRATLDGGLYGGVTFNGGWSASNNGKLTRLCITGTNASPCVFNGTYSETSQGGTNYSTYIAKEGPGTWVFKNNAGRSNRGVIDVRDGTLQFESLAEAGVVCSLGRSDLLFMDVVHSVTNAYGVSYAFSLGTPNTVGTLEYIGTSNALCSTRKLVLQGNGRLKSSAGLLALRAPIESLTAGTKTLYLAGSGTNVLGTVSDGAGVVGITKEDSGMWALSPSNNFSGPLVVQAGQLILDKRGYSYYKFNLTQRNYGITDPDTNIELTEFALYSADGVRRNLGLVRNGTNNIANLQPGQFCPMGSYPSYTKTVGDRFDDKIFDGDINSQWTVNATMLPGTPITLVMRLADGTPSISGYDLQYWTAGTNRYLSGWSIEGSRDGITWDKLSAVSNFFPVPPAIVAGPTKWWYSTGTDTPTNSFAIAEGNLTSPQLKAGVQVSVASGASLTLLGGAEPLGALSVNCDSGAGTINSLTLADTGRIDLTGTSLQGRNFALPLTIGTFTNPSVLSGWSLYINGQLVKDAALRWSTTSGTIRVVPLSTRIILN